MTFRKLRGFMDVGRVQGAPVTAAVAMLGSLTASRGPSLAELAFIAVISVLAHMSGAALNELWDRRLDSAVRALSRKPLVSGIISPEEAKGLVACFVPVALLTTLYVFGIPSFLALVLASAWMMWYCTAGKRTFIVNDLAQSVGYAAFALFGVLAAGAPTALTWPYLGVVAALVLFTQWGNNLKDADNDRRFGIPSLAVRSEVSSAIGLTASHPYFIYGTLVKVAFMAFCTVPIFLVPVPMEYLLIVLALGWPVQYFTMREFIGQKTRQEYVHLLLGDLLLSYPAAAVFAILGAGLEAYLLLSAFVFGGYLAGSALQSGAEFRFRWPSWRSRYRPRPAASPAELARAPFMVTWAAAGGARFSEVRSEMMAIRPPGPLPGRRSDGSRCDGVVIVRPIN